MSANWQGAQWQLAYTLNVARMDNRQAGRENADFFNVGNNVQGGYRFSQNFNLNAGLGRTANYANENGLKSYTYNYMTGFDWQFQDNWNLNGNYTLTTGQDTQSLAETRGRSLQTQVAWRFQVPTPTGDRKLPGQIFLRHVLNDNLNRDNVNIVLNTGRFWMIQSGITMSFF